jgi:hypothetical protein
LAMFIDIFTANGVNPSEALSFSNAKIYKEMIHQATLLAYIECIHTIMLIALCALPVLLLIPKNKLGTNLAHIH